MTRPITAAQETIRRANDLARACFAFSHEDFFLYARMRKVEDALKAFEARRSDANYLELTKQTLYLRRRLARLETKGPAP